MDFWLSLKWWESMIIIVLVVIIVSVVFVRRAPAEDLDCLHSAAAVREASPGAWPSWHYVDDAKCWYAKEGRHKRGREVVHLGRRSATLDARPRPFSVAAGAVPLPGPRIGYRMIPEWKSQELVALFDEAIAEGPNRGTRMRLFTEGLGMFDDDAETVAGR
jgi:hypothetical protein